MKMKLGLGHCLSNHTHHFIKYYAWLYSLIVLVLHLSIDQISCPNNVQFKRYIQKYTLPLLLMVIMTSQLLKLMGQFKI